MDPSLLAGAASGLIQSGVNAIFQSQQNKKNRKFSREMYDLQHQHSIENWHRENEYNSPQAQMRRLSDAGLSPHLVYGKGATATGGSIDSASAHNPNTAAPRLSGFDVLGKYMDFQMRQAQVNNLRTQNTVMLEDAKLRSAQTADTLASAQRRALTLALTVSYVSTLLIPVRNSYVSYVPLLILARIETGESNPFTPLQSLIYSLATGLSNPTLIYVKRASFLMTRFGCVLYNRTPKLG